MKNRNRRTAFLGLVLLFSCVVISGMLITSSDSPGVRSAEPDRQRILGEAPTYLENEGEQGISRREAVETVDPQLTDSPTPELPTTTEVVLPKIYFWGTTAIARWSDGQSRLNLCFPILQIASDTNRSIKIWGVSRDGEPYLLAHSDFAYQGLTTNVTIYRTEIDAFEQIAVTCGACKGGAAQLLATISGPPDGFRDSLSNPDPIMPARIVSYQQVDTTGDLARLTYDLQPGEVWPVPPAAWALVELDR